VPAQVRRNVPFAAFEASLWLGLYAGYLLLRDVSIGSAQEAVNVLGDEIFLGIDELRHGSALMHPWTLPRSAQVGPRRYL